MTRDMRRPNPDENRDCDEKAQKHVFLVDTLLKDLYTKWEHYARLMTEKEALTSSKDPHVEVRFMVQTEEAFGDLVHDFGRLREERANLDGIDHGAVTQEMKETLLDVLRDIADVFDDFEPQIAQAEEQQTALARQVLHGSEAAIAYFSKGQGAPIEKALHHLRELKANLHELHTLFSKRPLLGQREAFVKVIEGQLAACDAILQG